MLLAILNEVIYRSVDTNTWVNFKVFGITILTIIFSVVQLPIINKYKVDKKEKN
jgi:intracellular septation protein